MQCKTAHDQTVAPIREHACTYFFERYSFCLLACTLKIGRARIWIDSGDSCATCFPQHQSNFAAATGQVQHITQVRLPAINALAQRLTDRGFMWVAIAAASVFIESLDAEALILAPN